MLWSQIMFKECDIKLYLIISKPLILCERSVFKKNTAHIINENAKWQATMPENIVVSYKSYIITKSSYHTAGALSSMCEMHSATKIYTLMFYCNSPTLQTT